MSNEQEGSLLICLVKESGLLVGNAQLAVNGSEDALYLSEGKHTTK